MYPRKLRAPELLGPSIARLSDWGRGVLDGDKCRSDEVRCALVVNKYDEHFNS
jgi:hypothetical protein